MSDILITIRADDVLFTGITPKGEEWIQIYLPVDNFKCSLREALVKKWHAENQGCEVDVIDHLGMRIT